MKLSERRLPQDGKIKLNIRNRQIDIRVSTLPSTYGESVVMRILDKSELSLGLARLGFLSDTEKIWRGLISAANGVILITGPTGSGKTTTLYSCLNALNTPGRKIITVEDPIEYQLSGINQVQVREDIHLTFSRVLRACLRQAPNIIMVGEIRDSETARIAMNAAFTGHLVFSTLHTNDASGGVTRLIDQGIEPFLVASAVRGILAQRLVRNICPECRVHYRPTDEEMEVLGIRKSEKTPKLSRGQGCVNCNGSGYKGRCGIFELLQLTPDIQDLVYQKKSSAEIRDLAIRNGMRTLREDAVVKVLNGTTTMDELLRVTKIGET
jgi:general secretion pathway protein E/type IV pilus assembly protein PilB